MEQPKTLKSLINISFNLDQYELLTDICDSGEIARELLSRDKGIHIPMEIADMLDYSRIKDAYFTHHQGKFCPSGLVLKKDSAVIEEIYQDDRQPGFEKDCLFFGASVLKGKGYKCSDRDACPTGAIRSVIIQRSCPRCVCFIR